ncbi:MAG: SRPBCC domain-containing protein [Fimbriimonadaceae bacterium]|nr:SRPBCC domain-containing protein [Fimbriimonadaceae bacterium]
MTEPLSLEIIRRFPVSIQRVWEAWTDVEQFGIWGCPEDFQIILFEGEVEPGSAWRNRMRSPAGKEYVAVGEYQIVESPCRLVFSHQWERESGNLSPETLVTVTLEEFGHETQLTFHQIGFEDPEDRDSHIGGWSGAFENLAKHLHSPIVVIGDLASVSIEDGDQATLVFRREFRHEQSVIWSMITLKAHLERWAPFSPSRDLNYTGPVEIMMTDGPESDTYQEMVTAVTAPSLVEYTWGGDLLRWQLESVDMGTALTLRNRVSNAEWLSRVAAGWHICLQVMDHLAGGRDIPRIVGDEAKKHGWEELESLYRERLGLAKD